MAFDENTPIDELIAACDYSVVSELSGMEEYEQACANAELAAAELRRRDALLKALLALRESN